MNQGFPHRSIWDSGTLSVGHRPTRGLKIVVPLKNKRFHYSVEPSRCWCWAGEIGKGKTTTRPPARPVHLGQSVRLLVWEWWSHNFLSGNRTKNKSIKIADAAGGALLWDVFPLGDAEKPQNIIIIIIAVSGMFCCYCVSYFRLSCW